MHQPHAAHPAHAISLFDDMEVCLGNTLWANRAVTSAFTCMCHRTGGHEITARCIETLVVCDHGFALGLHSKALGGNRNSCGMISPRMDITQRLGHRSAGAGPARLDWQGNPARFHAFINSIALKQAGDPAQIILPPLRGDCGRSNCPDPAAPSMMG